MAAPKAAIDFDLLKEEIPQLLKELPQLLKTLTIRELCDALQKGFPEISKAFVSGEIDPTCGGKHADNLPTAEILMTKGVLLKEENGGKIYQFGSGQRLDSIRVKNLEDLPVKLGNVGNKSPSFYLPKDHQGDPTFVDTFKITPDGKVFPWTEASSQPMTGADIAKLCNLMQNHSFGIPPGCTIVDGVITGITSEMKWTTGQIDTWILKAGNGMEVKLPHFS
jgi:hypothetical protein